MKLITLAMKMAAPMKPPSSPMLRRVAVVRPMPPMESVQPPKKSAVARQQLTSMDEYSASMKKANFMAEYSVWYPATSSDSASGRSNGVRLFSAFIDTKKMKKARN